MRGVKVMYMTFFDSKRYYSAEKFSTFYETRNFFISSTLEQKEKYEEIFQKQSVRYGCAIVGNIFEERFEELDGKGLLFRHPLLKKETYASYLTELLSFYGYSFGGVLKNRTDYSIEEMIQGCLLCDLHFTYEQDTLVYRKDHREFYITVTEFKDRNFALRVFEKEDYEPQHKEDLLVTIRFLLTPLIMT